MCCAGPVLRNVTQLWSLQAERSSLGTSQSLFLCFHSCGRLTNERSSALFPHHTAKTRKGSAVSDFFFFLTSSVFLFAAVILLQSFWFSLSRHVTNGPSWPETSKTSDRYIRKRHSLICDLVVFSFTIQLFKNCFQTQRSSFYLLSQLMSTIYVQKYVAVF